MTLNTECMTTEELDSYVTATECPTAARALAERANDLDLFADDLQSEVDDLNESFRSLATRYDDTCADLTRIAEYAGAALKLLEGALTDENPELRRVLHNDAVKVIARILALASEERSPA